MKIIELPNTLPTVMFERLCLSLKQDPDNVLNLTLHADGVVTAGVVK